MLSFISTVLVARWLSLGDYGLMALVGIWTGTIAMVADMGLGWAIVQFPDVKDEELQGCFLGYPFDHHDSLHRAVRLRAGYCSMVQ